MSSTSGPAHRSVSSIRATPTANSAAPGSPHTPLRTISSTYGSPSALRAEEDCVVVELGNRYLRAGFAGDAVPKAIIKFGPEEHRRAGDYRKWEVDYEKTWRKRIQGNTWGEAYELWKLDLRGVDLGLVGDRVERAMRDAFTKYLLIDSRPRRMILALPSALPLPLVSKILDTLFASFQPPNISLMSAPVLASVAAGLRSALVVDIGWSETVVTSIYEYREVQCNRSIRGSKLLGEEMFKTLVEAIDPAALGDTPSPMKIGVGVRELISFEECEEVTARIAWCKPFKKESEEQPQVLKSMNEDDEPASHLRSPRISGQGGTDPITSIPLRSTNPPKTIQIPFSKLAEPCECALFAAGRLAGDLDDEELPLHLLVYRSLLQLPVDIRSMCMSRIVLVGGGSNLLGLRDRLLDEVNALTAQRGWDPVQGKAVEQLRTNLELQGLRSKQAGTGPREVLQGDDDPAAPKAVTAGLANQQADPIGDQLKREAMKGTLPVEHGTVRAINSLGAWSGASLLSHLKVAAVSVIDREQWLQHGIAGASRPGEVSSGHQRQSMGPGAFKSGAGDRPSWTLGQWA